MASIFNTGSIPAFSKEQQKIRRAAWKPNSARIEAHESSEPVTVYRSPKAEAERRARLEAEVAAKAAKRAETLAKMAATREAKNKAKAKSKKA